MTVERIGEAVRSHVRQRPIPPLLPRVVVLDLDDDIIAFRKNGNAVTARYSVEFRAEVRRDDGESFYFAFDACQDGQAVSIVEVDERATRAGQQR